MLDIGGKKIVRSVPAELNSDQNAIIEDAAATGFVSAEGVIARRGWTQLRTANALDKLLMVRRNGLFLSLLMPVRLSAAGMRFRRQLPRFFFWRFHVHRAHCKNAL